MSTFSVRLGAAGAAIALMALAVVALTWISPAGSASAATATGCNYATGGTGAYTNSICWIDFTPFDQTIARTTTGQPFTLTLPGGYKATFDVQERDVAGWPAGGMTSSTTPVPCVGCVPAFGNFANYTGIAGRPAFLGNNGVALTLANIQVTGPNGAALTGFGFVSTDDEATAVGESVETTSDTPLRLLEGLEPGTGSGCNFSSTVQVSPTDVLCTGTFSGNSTYGNMLVASTNPTFITQTIRTPTANGGAFGFLTSSVQVNKVVAARVNASDDFTVSAAAGSATIGSASTGTATSATTGVIPALAGVPFTASESATASTGTNLSDYSDSWTCTDDGAAMAGLTGVPGTSVSFTPAVGHSYVCAVTNTPLPKLDKAFSPTSVPVGSSSTLTFTISNGADLGAKTGWSFTDALPTGLAISAAPTTTCTSGVVTGAVGATSLTATGNLDAGQASCTVTASVTSTNAAGGTYTNGPANVTETGLRPPGSATVTFTALAATGVDAGHEVMLGTLLIAVGGVLVRAGVRRRTR